MVDDALGVAGGARGVEQRDRPPFVGGIVEALGGIALGQQRFVVERAQQLAAIRERVVDVDHQGARPGRLHEGKRLLDDRRELAIRSEEHTSELQSLMRISSAVFCLKKKTQPKKKT